MKILNWILFVIASIYILILILLIIQWLSFFVSPTKAEVETFFEENSCSPDSIKTDYYFEYVCAHYLRSHTTIAFGQIYDNPPDRFLFIYTPFYYFEYINPISFESHVYLFVNTKNEGALVYNPVNGDFVGRYDELMSEMGCEFLEGDSLFLANEKCSLTIRQTELNQLIKIRK